MSELSSSKQSRSAGASTSALLDTLNITDNRLSDAIYAEERPRLKGRIPRKPVYRRQTSTSSNTSNGLGSQQLQMSDAASVDTISSTHDASHTTSAEFSGRNSPEYAAGMPSYDTQVPAKRGGTIVSEQSVEPHSDLLEDRLKGEESRDMVHASSRFWNPFWLSRPWLIAYATLYFCLAGAVLALFFSATRSEGLATSKSTTEMAYFWKFLPTAGKSWLFDIGWRC